MYVLLVVVTHLLGAVYAARQSCLGAFTIVGGAAYQV